ncbi:MAG: pilus assembly protein PilM [Lachnospiraceae bacterium]
MAKVLSIEVGYSLVRICELDYKIKHPRIYSSLEATTPEGALEDGYIRQPEQLGKVIREALDQNGIRTKQAVYSISSAKIASREAFLPFVKEAKLPELVEASVGDYFPVDISDCKVTYQIIDTPEYPDGTKQYRLSLMTAPNELLESYYELSKLAGLTVTALDYSGNSLAVAAREVLNSGTYMAIKIDERSSLLTVFTDGVLVLQRTVPYGGDSAIETMIDLEEQESGERVSYERALELLRRRSCIRTSLDREAVESDDENDEEIKQFRFSIAESLSMLANSVLRVIDYYNSRNAGKQMEGIYLTGYAENFIGLTAFMGHELGTEVACLSDAGGETSIGGIKNSGAFIGCIGAALAPMDFIPDAYNEKKKRKAKAGTAKGVQAGGADYTRIAAVVFVGCVLLSVVLAVVSLVPYLEAKAKYRELAGRESELAPVEKVYRESVYAKQYLNEVKTMYEVTRTQNDRLPEFFKELERVLPASVNTLSFSVEAEKVSLNMNVESKEAAAKTIQELRTFQSLDTVTVTALNESVDELGSATVNFTVDCTYASILKDGETTEQDSAAQ